MKINRNFLRGGRYSARGKLYSTRAGSSYIETRDQLQLPRTVFIDGDIHAIDRVRSTRLQDRAQAVTRLAMTAGVIFFP